MISKTFQIELSILDFFKFLDDNKALESFLKEVEAQSLYGGLYTFLSSYSPNRWISAGFAWNATAQGTGYWEAIQTRWCTMLFGEDVGSLSTEERIELLRRVTWTVTGIEPYNKK